MAAISDQELLVKAQSRSGRGQSQKILPLPDEDDDGDARGKAGDYRIRYELDDGTQPCRAECNENDAGHQGCDLQSGDAVLCRNDGQYRNERAGGPDTCMRVPPKRDVHQPRDNRRIQPLLRRAPEAIANAIARGSATTPTTRPASRLLRMCPRDHSPAVLACSSAIMIAWLYRLRRRRAVTRCTGGSTLTAAVARSRLRVQGRHDYRHAGCDPPRIVNRVRK